MASVLTVLNKLQELGVTVRTEGAKLVFTPGSKVPPEMVAEIKAHKPEIMARLRSHASLHDIPFPMGYSGLPRAQVQMAEAIQDKLNIKDPVLRKYNILVWVRGHPVGNDEIRRDSCRGRGRAEGMIKEAIVAAMEASPLVVLTHLALSDLGSECGNPESTIRWLLSEVNRLGKPVGINSPSKDGSQTIFLPPSGWTPERVNGYVATAYPAMGSVFGLVSKMTTFKAGYGA